MRALSCQASKNLQIDKCDKSVKLCSCRIPCRGVAVQCLDVRVPCRGVAVMVFFCSAGDYRRLTVPAGDYRRLHATAGDTTRWFHFFANYTRRLPATAGDRRRPPATAGNSVCKFVCAMLLQRKCIQSLVLIMYLSHICWPGDTRRQIVCVLQFCNFSFFKFFISPRSICRFVRPS